MKFPSFRRTQEDLDELSTEVRFERLERKVNQLRRGYLPAIVTAVVATYLAFHDIGLNSHTFSKLRTDEHGTKVAAVHTRKVQREGEPTGVCLREAMKAGLPILFDGANSLEKAESKAPAAARAQVELFVGFARSVEAPLKEYVKLQEDRYTNVTCPVPQKKKTVRRHDKL